MPKNLIVCCDGTWNSQDQSEGGLPALTNVRKFYEALLGEDASGGKQISYYDRGVGTKGLTLQRIFDGATGTGLSRNIQEAYEFLVEHYAPGDRIFLVGFSRGAYTARSLAGMIKCCGLLKQEHLNLLSQAFQCYKAQKGKHPKADATKFLQGKIHEGVRIHFIGVWDTVGALGIPIWGWQFNLLAIWQNKFNNTDLSDIVDQAYHALAMDEQRASFMPALWTVAPNTTPPRKFEQVWFRGVHSNVGGGYWNSGLANIALQWMVEKAEAAGALFINGVLTEHPPKPAGILHESLNGVFKLAGAWPRWFPTVKSPTDKDYNPSFGYLHSSVFERDQFLPHFDGGEQPLRWLKPGDTAVVEVSAQRWWNRTGVVLEKGAEYLVEAEGEWVDGKRRISPEGEIRSWGWSLANWALRKPKANWFELIGLINFPRYRELKEESLLKGLYYLLIKDPPDLTRMLIRIGKQKIIEPKHTGVFYCFANDVWLAYWNNKGFLRVKVTRQK